MAKPPLQAPKKSAAVKVTDDLQAYKDLMTDQNKSVSQQTQKQRQDFEKMQKQIKNNPGKIKEEEFEDELDDQMAQSLFAEADQMGIFQAAPNDGVDYTQALKQIEKHIAEAQSQPQKEPESKPKKATADEDQNLEEISDDNEELYN